MICNNKYCNTKSCTNEIKLNNRKCDRCISDKYILYKEDLVGVSGNVCGTIHVYKITPINTNCKLRCHHIFNGEYIHDIKNRPDKIEVNPVDNWNIIWNHCVEWCNDINISKYKGKLKKGIIYKESNWIHSVVVDKKNNMYRILGAWG
jgi:hypothetical protein